MFARLISNNTRSISRLFSSFSKNYICDASVIEIYQTKTKFKSIVDQQEHQFFYKNDKQIQVPSVFKQISSNSSLPDNSYYLTNSTSDPSKNQISIDDFIDTSFWNNRSKGRFPGLIGMEFLSVKNGHVRCQLKVREELLAPNGYLHAGVVVTVADTACGYGCMQSKPSDAKLFTTIELKSNFMGTVKPPALISCEARLAHGGRTTQVWDAEVKDTEKNKTIAVFRCTQLIIY